MKSPCALVLLGVYVATHVSVQAVNYEQWKPFPYCNHIKYIRDTRVTPLETEQRERVESLAQVQIIARHGSRAPYSRVFCWDQADNDPTDAEWNCSTTSVSSQDIGYTAPSGYGRLYGKTYLDGLNILNGSCVVGALLPEGREQHRLNGQLLRDAYIGDEKLQLFNSSALENIPKGSIYLRSDDEERTLGSGQALVDGFFPPDNFHPALDAMLHWHTADLATDYIDTNYRICKAMGHFARLSSLGPVLQKHLTSTTTAYFEQDVRKLIGRFSWDTIFECLSVARCNHLALPAGMDEALFDRITQEVEFRQGAFLTHNNSWFAKLAMQPMIHDIIKRIDHVVEATAEHPATRLSITVGHDTTIMPLLAALLRNNWDRKWTPFAGLFVVELYKLKTQKYAVRLLMSGKVLHVPECTDTLCDLDQFMQAVDFARSPRDCNIPIEHFSLNLVLESIANVASSAASPSSLVLIALSAMCVALAIGYRRERVRRLTGEGERLLPYGSRS